MINNNLCALVRVSRRLFLTSTLRRRELQGAPSDLTDNLPLPAARAKMIVRDGKGGNSREVRTATPTWGAGNARGRAEMRARRPNLCRRGGWLRFFENHVGCPPGRHARVR